MAGPEDRPEWRELYIPMRVAQAIVDSLEDGEGGWLRLSNTQQLMWATGQPIQVTPRQKDLIRLYMADMFISSELTGPGALEEKDSD